MKTLTSALVGAAVATGLVGFGAMTARATQTAEVVKTSRVDLVDGEGHTRARLSLDSGNPDLVCYTRDGKPVSAIGVTNTSNPYVSLHRKDDGLSIVSGNADTGDPNISVFGANGKPLVILGLVPGDKPSILLKSAADRSSASLGLRPAGEYQLVITGKDGQPRVPVLTEK
jgi:hypothetical protein